MDVFILICKLSYLTGIAMCMNIWTILAFDLERYLMISLSIKHAKLIKTISKSVVYISLLWCVLFATPLLNIAQIDKNFKICWLKTQSQNTLKVTTYLFWFSICLYLSAPIIFLPLLSILLGTKIIKLLMRSKTLQPNAKQKMQLKEIKAALIQVLVSLYTLFCLSPNASFLIITFGKNKIIILMYILSFNKVHCLSVT